MLEIKVSIHHTHTIHVWYIYLHLVDFYGKCRKIYQVNIPYMDGMGHVTCPPEASQMKVDQMFDSDSNDLFLQKVGRMFR